MGNSSLLACAVLQSCHLGTNLSHKDIAVFLYLVYYTSFFFPRRWQPCLFPSDMIHPAQQVITQHKRASTLFFKANQDFFFLLIQEEMKEKTFKRFFSHSAHEFLGGKKLDFSTCFEVVESHQCSSMSFPEKNPHKHH